MVESIRVATLSGYFEIMAGFGTDLRPLLQEQGLHADQLANPQHLIPAAAAIRLLERSALVAECPTLGLRMAEGRTPANLGAPGLLIAHQPTLRAALTALREFRLRINSTLALHIEERDGEAILREDFFLSRPEPSRQASDLGLGVLIRLCDSILGTQWSPRSVHFSHQSPPMPDMPIFQRLFRCRPTFDSEFNGIVIASDDLDRPNPVADPQFALYARQLLDSTMNPTNRSISQEVDQFIKLLIVSERVTIQRCAQSMGLTVRTLQRLLDAEGDSFSNLLNSARMQLSTQYLSNPRLRITDIADMLGYSSISAFTRWHIKFFGLPPMERRKRLVLR